MDDSLLRGTYGTALGNQMLGFALSDTCFFAALSGCGVQAAAMVYTLTVPLAALLSFVFLADGFRF